MRLDRLDLTRYGKFTDRVLDFGAAIPGKPDFHIVFGPNEAGKSTTMAAFLDLLFGIETQSRYNFLHPYPTMKIGAALQLDSGPVELIRLKRRNGLLDASEQPIPELVLQAELGAIDRDAYRTMFSLDDETLERGGDSILASKGDLGALLFSASAGLADFSAVLERLKRDADQFHKPRSRSSGLHALKAELVELKTRRDALDTFAADYARLVQERDRAGQAYDLASRERAALRARHDEILRMLAAMPRLAALRGLQSRLASLAGIPEAPTGWREDIGPLRDEAITLQTRAETLAGERRAALDALNALEPDNAALDLADRFAMLDDLRSRHITADKDLPDRRLRLFEAEARVAALLHRLGQAGASEPQRLVLSAQATGVLRHLIEQHSGVIADLKAATRERADAEAHLAALMEKSGGEPGPALDEAASGRLSTVLTQVRAQDFAIRQKRAERDLVEHEAALNAAMSVLRPWAGEAAVLLSVPVPASATLENWRTKLRQIETRYEQAEAEAEKLETERQKLQAELATITGIGGVVDDAEAFASRKARQDAWARHVAALSAETAGVFEAALGRDDVITEGRLRHQKELARLYELSIRISTLEVEIRRAKATGDAARADLAALNTEISGAPEAIGLPLATRLPELEGWLARHEKALTVFRLLQQAKRDRAEAVADAKASGTLLGKALEAASIPCPAGSEMADLLHLAQATLDRQAARKADRAALEDARRQLTSRQKQQDAAEKAVIAWKNEWVNACSATWLGEGQTPDGVSDVLAVLAELGPALENRDSLAERIDKMEEDQRSFAAGIAGLDAALMSHDEAESHSDRTALEQAGIIARRIEAARTDAARRAQVAETLAEIDARQRQLEAALLLHERRKAGMLRHFGVVSLGEVEQCLRNLNLRADLLAEVEATTREILASMRCDKIEEVEALLDAADRGPLEAEQVELGTRLADQDRRTAEVFSEHSKAEDRLAAVGGDEAAARLEAERRTLLAVIEDKAAGYLRLRLGILGAEQALRLYRDRHRSSMMARASAAFAAISRDAYRGLATQSEKDAEILIAIAADGGSKRAEDLSKGTRFQLYLALRAAGYEEFAAYRPSVPFLADDILETFDDERAEATFALFGTMARTGQVIYLTHHAHLCEIARKVVPEVRVHDLRGFSG